MMAHTQAFEYQTSQVLTPRSYSMFPGALADNASVQYWRTPPPHTPLALKMGVDSASKPMWLLPQPIAQVPFAEGMYQE